MTKHLALSPAKRPTVSPFESSSKHTRTAQIVVMRKIKWLSLPKTQISWYT